MLRGALGMLRKNTGNANNATPLPSHARNAAPTHNAGDTQTQCGTLQTNKQKKRQNVMAALAPIEKLSKVQ